MILQNLMIDYDARADVLYLSIGNPREAVCLEPEEGILVRVEPDTNNVVGLTIIDFLYRFKGKNRLILPILAQLDIPSQLMEPFKR